MGEVPSTITQEVAPRARDRDGDVPWLFLVLVCNDLAGPSLRLALDEVDEVQIGRGERTAVERREAAGRRVLDVRVADRWMSSVHTRLVRAADGFVALDCGSKNGTALDGKPLDRALLRDGNLLDLGGTFFLYRHLPPSPDGTRDRAVAAARDEIPGLTTLHTGFEAELERLRRVAPTTIPVEVRGETGAGKELVARAIHVLSGRRGELAAINCGALPDELIESELFGHQRGAFTGAVADRPGMVRSAHDGTLFLDEVAELPLPAQATLLRALQEGEVKPVGAARPVQVDVRVVSATHADIERRVEEGRFRADLAARLAGFRLVLPPLRERRCDLGLLVQTLLARRPPSTTSATVQLTREAARALMLHAYPSNVRELERALSLAVALAGSSPIDVAHLPEAMRRRREAAPDAPPPSPRRPLSDEEQRHRDELVQLLEAHEGNIAAVARACGKAPMQVHRWLKRYGLDPEHFRKR